MPGYRTTQLAPELLAIITQCIIHKPIAYSFFMNKTQFQAFLGTQRKLSNKWWNLRRHQHLSWDLNIDFELKLQVYKNISVALLDLFTCSCSYLYSSHSWTLHWPFEGSIHLEQRLLKISTQQQKKCHRAVVKTHKHIYTFASH